MNLSNDITKPSFRGTDGRWRIRFPYDSKRLIFAPPLLLDEKVAVLFFVHHEPQDQPSGDQEVCVPGVLLAPASNPVMDATWDGKAAPNKVLDAQVERIEVPPWFTPKNAMRASEFVVKTVWQRCRESERGRRLLRREERAQFRMHRLSIALDVCPLFAYERSFQREFAAHPTLKKMKLDPPAALHDVLALSALCGSTLRALSRR